MRRLAGLLLVGIVLNAISAGGGLKPHEERALDGAMPEPAAPAIPQTSSYTAYLPAVFRSYLPDYMSPFGIAMYGDISETSGLGKMQAAGSGWVTTYFWWADVEPNAPVNGVHTYDWSRFDEAVRSAHAAGMNVFVLFTGNPGWAAELAGGPAYSAHVQDLVSMAAAAAERYNGDGYNDAPGSPVVNYWSFYAEPDNGSFPRAQVSFKGYWGNNPIGYAVMLAGVSTAMHAANPKAVVMIGGLAYDFFTPDGPYVQTFLGKTLDALNALAAANGDPRRAAAYINAVAFHYYPISTAYWPTIREKALEIRSTMAARGVGNLPLIVPEMGYWSEAVPPVPSLNSNEDKQARGLVQMFVRGMSVGIRQLSWYTVFDNGPSTEAHGLFRGTNLNDPKPSYSAYATLTKELNGTTYTGALTTDGAEGYTFTRWNGRTESVVWATQPSAQVAFQQSCLRRVDHLGSVTTPIYDGDATWDMDSVAGQITLQVFQDQPIYVGNC